SFSDLFRTVRARGPPLSGRPGKIRKKLFAPRPVVSYDTRNTPFTKVGRSRPGALYSRQDLSRPQRAPPVTAPGERSDALRPAPALELRPLLELAETPVMLTDDLVQASPVPKSRPWSPWVLAGLLQLMLLSLGFLATVYFYRTVGRGSLLQQALTDTNGLE